MKLSKESKIRVLENFYALDYIFFGKPLNEVKIKDDCNVCKHALVAEYLTSKASLLGTLVEIIKLADHSPKKLTESTNVEKIKEKAIKSGKIAVKNGKLLVCREQTKTEIKNLLVSCLSEGKKVDELNVIKEKAYSLAVDNLLIARTLSESKDVKKMNDWDGRIVEDAYKILRDSLVSSAIQIQKKISK